MPRRVQSLVPRVSEVFARRYDDETRFALRAESIALQYYLVFLASAVDRLTKAFAAAKLCSGFLLREARPWKNGRIREEKIWNVVRL
jgi:hypothetical protein